MNYTQLFWLRRKWAAVTRWYFRRSDFAQFNLWMWGMLVLWLAFYFTKA